MAYSPSWSFGPFRLDPVGACLWRGDQLIALRPKPFGVLACLVAHAGQVVSKETLLETVWPNTMVSEGVLKTCMGQIRQTLGDLAQTPQYIATMHRRGYRFIAPVTAVEDLPETPEEPVSLHPPTGTPAQRPQPAPPPSRVVVAREAELVHLHQCFARMLQGERQVVFVTGEAGIGKTTLVETFVAQLPDTADVWIGHGRCIEQYGAGEAYLPLLEALGQLGRRPDGARLVTLLGQQAPNWLLQLPALVPAGEFEVLQRRTRGTTRGRMLRELAEAVETLTVASPLVLVLEDLHWSDMSTVEWLAYVARRRADAQLLVLGTYRPVEAIVRAHPVHAVVQDLQVQGLGTELVLGYLSEAEVIAYMARRFGVQALPNTLARLLQQRTNGNPLFLAMVVDDLVRQGVLRQSVTGWELAGALEVTVVGAPESLRQLMERQLAQLSAEDQDVVAAASVAGVAFAVAAVAAGVDRTVEAVETQCAALARRGQFLQMQGATDWPDGTVTAQYEFRHALYQEIFYECVPVSRRARWHQQIGARLEVGYGPQAREIAAELAEHFVRGRDARRAVQYLHDAGENAVQQSAYQEGIAHLTQGLAILTTLPDTSERRQRELTLQLTLGTALIPTTGYTQVVETVYSRAWELCQQVGETPQRFPVLRGLLATSAQRGKLQTARELCATCFRLARRQHRPDLLLEAHRMLASVWLPLGAFPRARQQAERSLTLYDVQHHRAHAFLDAPDPGVSCLIYAALTLWYLGYPDAAIQRCHEALTLAEELEPSHSLAWARSFAATLHQLRQEASQAQAQAEVSIALYREQGCTFWVSRGTILRGWALATRGQVEEGLAQMRQGLAAHRAIGIKLELPSYLALLAKECERAGQIDEGLTMLAEALETAHKTREGWWEAELYRLQGQLLLALSQDKHVEAEACFRRALEVARHQQAKSWELRTATSLSRLWQQQGKHADARQLLTPIYDWFTEGFDTVDLLEAKALLAELHA